MITKVMPRPLCGAPFEEIKILHLAADYAQCAVCGCEAKLRSWQNRSPNKAVTTESTKSVADIPDDELLRRAVTAAKGYWRKGAKGPRWAAVSLLFGLGSTYSMQLCRRFYLDPDEQVGR